MILEQGHPLQAIERECGDRSGLPAAWIRSSR